jgi:hypothetical protein
MEAAEAVSFRSSSCIPSFLYVFATLDFVFCIFFLAIKHKGHRYSTENPGTPLQCTEFSWPFDDFIDAFRVEGRFVLAKLSSNYAGDCHLSFCNSHTAKSRPEFSIFVPSMLLIINRAIDVSGQRIPSFVGRC